jgi:predicted DNA-binding transcriptional regulator AlpA
MLLSHRGAAELDGLSRTARERLVKAGVYPQPVKITSRRLGFVADEVRAWVLSRIAARDAGVPTDLDAVLVATAPKAQLQAGAAK